MEPVQHAQAAVHHRPQPHQDLLLACHGNNFCCMLKGRCHFHVRDGQAERVPPAQQILQP